MAPIAVPLALSGVLALSLGISSCPLGPGPARAIESIVVLQETRTAEKGKKTVQHVAVLKNAGDRPVRGLRVTVELYDFFGKLLWARTTAPSPAALRPGDTATLSLPTPDLPAHRRTAYRFDHRPP
jgi:hypothetical protein